MNFHSILSLYKKPENKIRIRNVYQLLRRELMKWILRNIFITMGNHIVKYLYFDDIPRISMFSIEIGEHFCARRQLIDISNANFIFWFFIKWKYAMEVHGKTAEILVCAWEIRIFNFLLFSLTKMSGEVYPPISGSEICRIVAQNRRCWRGWMGRVSCVSNIRIL